MTCILLVEDDDEIRTTTAAILTHLGFEVVQASNGQEALGRLLIPHNGIEIVLCDVQMPVMGGDRLIERVREAGLAVPFVFWTGGCSPVQRARIAAHDAPVIRKPSNMGYVAATLKQQLVAVA